MNASPAFEFSRSSLQPVPAQRACRIALLGFGTVGRSVATILQGGSFPQLRLDMIYNRRVDRKRVPWVSPQVRWTDDLEEVLASDADVVLELAGGLEPAYSWVKSPARPGVGSSAKRSRYVVWKLIAKLPNAVSGKR